MTMLAPAKQRAEKAHCFHNLGQFRYALFIKVAARLKGVGLNQVNGNVLNGSFSIDSRSPLCNFCQNGGANVQAQLMLCHVCIQARSLLRHLSLLLMTTNGFYGWDRRKPPAFTLNFFCKLSVGS